MAARTWRSILAGAAIGAAIVLVAVIGILAIFIYQHHHSRIVTADVASSAIDSERSRFSARPALVEVRDGADPVLHASAQPASNPPRTFHVLLFDTRSGRLVRIDLPMAFVRFRWSDGFTYLGQMTFLEDTEFDPDRVGLSIADLDRYGA